MKSNRKGRKQTIQSKVVTLSHRISAITRKAHKLWEQGRWCAGQIFSPANVNANPPNIFVHLQQLWLHNAHQFKVFLHLLPPFGRNLKGEFWDPQFWGLGECKGVGICTNRKPTHDFPITSNMKFCSICHVSPEFQCQTMPPHLTPVWGLGWTWGVKIVLIEMST